MEPSQSESNLMAVLTGILEDSVQTLKRIEKAVNESTKIATEMLERIDLIDKKIESGFVAVVKKALPSLEHKFIEKIESVGGEMGDLTSILPDIITKLQQSMQILTIQNLIKELDKTSPTKKTAADKPNGSSEQPEIKSAPKKGAPPSSDSSPSAPPAPKQPSQPDQNGENKEHLLKPSSFFGS